MQIPKPQVFLYSILIFILKLGSFSKVKNFFRLFPIPFQQKPFEPMPLFQSIELLALFPTAFDVKHRINVTKHNNVKHPPFLEKVSTKEAAKLFLQLPILRGIRLRVPDYFV